MKASTIQWHLARDNQIKLARFCEKHKTKSYAGAPHPQIGRNEWFFEIEYWFDNGARITVELMAGDKKSYSVADHFQVMSYELGAA